MNHVFNLNYLIFGRFFTISGESWRLVSSGVSAPENDIVINVNVDFQTLPSGKSKVNYTIQTIVKLGNICLYLVGYQNFPVVVIGS